MPIKNKKKGNCFFTLSTVNSIVFSLFLLSITACFDTDENVVVPPPPVVVEPEPEPEPEPDPSELTGPVFGDLPEGLEEANHGAFEGGETGSGADTSANNIIQKSDQRDDGIFNVPTNGAPSPLFGAQPFSQQM